MLDKILSNLCNYMDEEFAKAGKVYAWGKENIASLVLFIITMIMTYGYEITNFSMSIDEERMMTRGADVKAQLVNSRYSSGFIHAILPHKTLPFWYEFICALLICIIAVCIATIIYRFVASKIAATIFAVIYISMPIHTYTSMFSLECLTLTLGYLCCIASAYCVYEWGKSHKKYKCVLGIIYAGISFGFGQSFIPVFASLICMLVICMVLAGEQEVWHFIMKAIVVLLGALLCYILINKVIHYYIIEDVGYLDTYFRWGTASTQTTIQNVLQTLKGMNCYPVVNRGYNTLPVLNVVWIISTLLGLIKIEKKRVQYLLGMLGLLFSNGLMVMALGGYLPPRTGRAIPIFAGMTVCIMYLLFNKKWLKRIVILFTFFIVIYQSVTVVELNYMDYQRQSRDTAEVERVASAIKQLGYGTIPDKPVAFVNVDSSLDGYWQSDNTFALSYFTIGEHKLKSYFESMGYPYQWCSEEMLRKAENIVNMKEIPQWPMDGSIIVEEGIIIINFGSESESVLPAK